jgi:hypothetical protein
MCRRRPATDQKLQQNYGADEHDQHEHSPYDLPGEPHARRHRHAWLMPTHITLKHKHSGLCSRFFDVFSRKWDHVPVIVVSGLFSRAQRAGLHL